jgi:hypothetical protein
VTKRLLIAALLCAVTLPLFADFDDIADAIERQRGVHRVWTPGVGLARVFVWIIRPKGVRDVQVAVFEGAENIDPSNLHAILRSHIGAGFAPLVKVWSKSSDEWSFIYARPHGRNDRVELIVLSRDDEDAVLVRVDVDATVLAKELHEHPRYVSKLARQ